VQTFRPFSVTHAVAVVALVTTVWVLVTLRRTWGRSLDRALALVAFVIFLVVNAWPLLPRHFDLSWSLPIHVCDITTGCVPLALLGRRTPRALLYFWGLGLSTQGFITPDLQDGPAKAGFWMFWLAHFSVVGGGLYDVTARGYRPAWRDWRAAVGIGVAYILVLLAIDLSLGVNYGYVGRGTPGQPTLVDALGPWPWRVPAIVALAVATMTLLMVPWHLVARTTRPRS
jgi:hypothetical integral membrane protein (TIGR02206 family)